MTWCRPFCRNAQKPPASKRSPLSPRLGDFNEDLHVFGLDALRAAVRIQLAPEDVSRFLLLSATVG